MSLCSVADTKEFDMTQAVYSCTALVGTGKKGVLPQDENGYYDVILGAFDYYNSKGMLYDFNAVKGIFDASSDLMRRIKNGALHGECGHPRRAPGMSQAEFMHRCLDVHETNISHHIREVYIDDKCLVDPSGKPIVAVRGWVKPAGPKGPALKEALDNGPQNVAFSVRSFADEKMGPNSTIIRLIRLLVTWDWVMEPGINIASKYTHPALESMMSDTYFTESLVAEVEKIEKELGVAMENGGVAVDLLRKAYSVNATGTRIRQWGSSAW